MAAPLTNSKRFSVIIVGVLACAILVGFLWNHARAGIEQTSAGVCHQLDLDRVIATLKVSGIDAVGNCEVGECDVMIRNEDSTRATMVLSTLREQHPDYFFDVKMPTRHVPAPQK